MNKGEQAFYIVAAVALVGIVGGFAWGVYKILSSTSDFGKKFAKTKAGQDLSTFIAKHLDSGVDFTANAQALIDAGVLDTSKDSSERIQAYKDITGEFPKWLPGIGPIDSTTGVPTGAP